MANLTSNAFISLFANDGYITTSKYLIRKLGLLEATLIGELCSEHTYWANRNDNFDGWFASTISNIEENCGISRKLQEKTIKNLTKQGIIEIKNMGLPSKRHFKIITDSLYKLFDSNGHNSNADNQEICNSLNTSLPNHERTKNEENTQNTPHNTSSYKFVPTGQTRLPQRDKLDCLSETNSNNNNNNNNNNNPTPSPNDCVTKASRSSDLNSEEKETESLVNEEKLNNCPTFGNVLEYSKTFGNKLVIDPDWFFYYNDKRKWLDNNGNKIRSWKALFSNWNSVKTKELAKESQLKQEKETKRQKKLQLQEDYEKAKESERAKKIAETTQMECPKCGRKFPDENITFSIGSSTMTCRQCGISWRIKRKTRDKGKSSCVS